MGSDFEHIGDKRTTIYSSQTGVAALYFRSNLDVNTDGSPRSYHPDDPWATKGLAYNNMANALTDVRKSGGESLLCEPRKGPCYSQLLKGFEAARDSNYSPDAAIQVKTKNIIPWSIRPEQTWPVPCRIQSGPFTGYFVSQTALSVDSSKAECDPARYLDPVHFNAVVLPKGIAWASQGVRTDKGDLVVVQDTATNVTSFAIVGDSGPSGSIGEGSIRLAAALGKRNFGGNETYADIKKLARGDVQYLLFPKHDIRNVVGARYSQADIDKAAQEVFEQWGGRNRLAACKPLAR